MVTWDKIRLYVAIIAFVGMVVLLIYTRVLERKLEMASKKSEIEQTAIQVLGSLLIQAGMSEDDLKVILEHELNQKFEKPKK